MANSQNLCLFTGNLGRDPEVKYSQSGTAVASFSLAVGGSKKENGTWVDHTEWVNLVALGKRAEVIRDYCQKGSKIRVTTRVQTRKWQDQSGQDRYTTEFVIDDLELLTPKQEGQAPRPQQAPKPQAPQQQPQQLVDDMDDDIPFNVEAA